MQSIPGLLSYSMYPGHSSSVVYAYYCTEEETIWEQGESSINMITKLLLMAIFRTYIMSVMHG